MPAGAQFTEAGALIRAERSVDNADILLGTWTEISAELYAAVPWIVLDEEVVRAMTGGEIAAAQAAVVNYQNASVELNANRTVSFTSGMSAATIQGYIDAQPKNLGGYTLKFSFGDGTYNTSMTSALTFSRFYNGTLQIYGNEGDTAGLATNQSVFLDFSAGTSSGIYLLDCQATVYVRWLKIKISDTASIAGIISERGRAVNVSYNYILGAGKTAANTGIHYDWTKGWCSANYVDTVDTGLRVHLATMVSFQNDDTGTAPNYGLRASWGGVMAKYYTDQPGGTVAAELEEYGGEIR